jgi:hypothetical protein
LRRPVEKRLHRKRRRAERDHPGAEPPELYRRGREWVPQRVLPGRLADVRQQPSAQQQAAPAAEDDAFGVEEVDQRADPGAQVPRGLVQDGGRARRRAGGVDQLRERQLLVIGRHRPSVAGEDGLGPGVCLQAAG